MNVPNVTDALLRIVASRPEISYTGAEANACHSNGMYARLTSTKTAANLVSATGRPTGVMSLTFLFTVLTRLVSGPLCRLREKKVARISLAGVRCIQS
jgi:hypothetical protein